MIFRNNLYLFYFCAHCSSCHLNLSLFILNMHVEIQCFSFFKDQSVETQVSYESIFEKSRISLKKAMHQEHKFQKRTKNGMKSCNS